MVRADPPAPRETPIDWPSWPEIGHPAPHGKRQCTRDSLVDRQSEEAKMNLKVHWKDLQTARWIVLGVSVLLLAMTTGCEQGTAAPPSKDKGPTANLLIQFDRATGEIKDIKLNGKSGTDCEDNPTSPLCAELPELSNPGLRIQSDKEGLAVSTLPASALTAAFISDAEAASARICLVIAGRRTCFNL